MTIGENISHFRKRANLTQEALAQKLSVTNQAVSKWESDQCCPDIALLPKLADIFGISTDTLLGRANTGPICSFPWPDDDVLHIVVFHGHTFVGESPNAREMTFQYEGPALNISCAVNLRCEDVAGDICAAGSVTCDKVGGSINAGGSVTCDSVTGDIRAGGNVTCDDVEGDIHAGGMITCDTVHGNVEAGANITCAEICGNVTAEGDIYCDEINVEPPSDHPQRESQPKSIHIHKAEKTEGSTHTITYTISKD